MKWMFAPLLVLALLAPAVTSALAPDRTKATLEAIKKKLPKVVRDWIDKKTSSLLGMVGCQSMALSSPRVLDRPPEYFPPPPPWLRELMSQENAASVTPDLAKKKLEALKKKLPEVVKTWIDKETFEDGGEVKLVRQVSPSKAKLTILIGSQQEILTVYLRYFDGTWTSTRYETAWHMEPFGKTNAFKVSAMHKLLLAIDDLSEK